MMLATPVRSSEWSSTTRTRARARATAAGTTSASVVAIGGTRNRKRRRFPCQHDLGAGARRGHERQRRADALGALAHAGHAEAAVAAVAGDAAAIVGHRQQESDATDRARPHHDAAGARAAAPPAA